MKALCIDDKRINARNYVIQLSIGEYYNLIMDRLNDNEYQRKRVRNAGSIYDLLKQDLIKGCVMPHIGALYTGHILEDGYGVIVGIAALLIFADKR